MKITHNKVGQNLNLTDSSKTDKAKEALTTNRTQKINSLKNELDLDAANNASAKVELSSKATDIQKIKDIAKSAPDVDLAKVEKFQKLIDSGKYKIDAKGIADKMVDEQLSLARMQNPEN